jgi:hypothetical protein
MKNKNSSPSEVMSLYHAYRLIAITQLVEEYAYKNRAKMVQRLIALKHKEEEKIGQNKPLEAQYGCQNPGTNGNSWGIK